MVYIFLVPLFLPSYLCFPHRLLLKIVTKINQAAKKKKKERNWKGKIEQKKCLLKREKKKEGEEERNID